MNSKSSSEYVFSTSKMYLHRNSFPGCYWNLEYFEYMWKNVSRVFCVKICDNLIVDMDLLDNPLIQSATGMLGFQLQHLQGTNPVNYNCKGWLKSSRENPTTKCVIGFLQDSNWLVLYDFNSVELRNYPGLFEQKCHKGIF